MDILSESLQLADIIAVGRNDAWNAVPALLRYKKIYMSDLSGQTKIDGLECLFDGRFNGFEHGAYGSGSWIHILL